MDSGHDRLSDLPDDLIIKILSFVGIKDAIKASVLSSGWRFLWTSIPHLSFSTEDFSTMDKFSDFVTHVLSRHNNQAQLSSVKLYICGKDDTDVAQRIMDHAFSLVVEQVNVTCLFEEDNGFLLSVSSAQTLKHLTLTRTFRHDDITLSLTQELSSLTTLHLDYITLYNGFFSKCPNLENLTLNTCKMLGSDVLSICHSQLSNLTLENSDFRIPNINVVTPQLKNLTISQYSGSFRMSADKIASLHYNGPAPFMFSTDGFHSLEKAQLSLHTIGSLHAPVIIKLLQKLHNVKVLSLTMEIIQILNSSVELISRQPSPLANLESLKILPKLQFYMSGRNTRVNMSTEVKNYLLNSSPKATLTEREQCCDITAGDVPYFV